ncbi:MAG: uroporphyrinogen-III synthase [Conexivisphaera sp.]
MPLSTARFIDWLVRELGSPPVRAPPVLRPVPVASRAEALEAASLGLPAVVTSPNAVDAMASLLPRDLLESALSDSIAIGPMTASAILDVVPGARVSVPRSHDSASLIALLRGGRRVLWCSTGVEESLARAVYRAGGIVVRLYRLEVDERSADEIRSSLSADDLVVFASMASVEAWSRVRIGLAPRPRAAAISRRVAAALRGDESISSLAVFEMGDMRKFPEFLRAAHG